MTTQAVTDATFDAEVKESDIPVVVDFWAEWCGPCKQIGPALEEASSALEGKVKVVKVDIEQDMGVASSLGVRGIPALFVFKNGEIVNQKSGTTGVTTGPLMQKWIEDSI